MIETGGLPMATAILYYSFTGRTKTLAEETAAESGAKLFEILEMKKRSSFAAFIPGCPQAMGLKRSAIEPVDIDFSAYDEIVVMGPIWAGHPAPAVNSAIDLLPGGKSVSLICTGGKGGDDLSKTAALITARGCTVKETRCVGAKDL
jgi:flavodoxin